MNDKWGCRVEMFKWCTTGMLIGLWLGYIANRPVRIVHDEPTHVARSPLPTLFLVPPMPDEMDPNVEYLYLDGDPNWAVDPRSLDNPNGPAIPQSLRKRLLQKTGD